MAERASEVAERIMQATIRDQYRSASDLFELVPDCYRLLQWVECEQF